MAMSDPNVVREALNAAIDAFNQEGYGIPTREPEIDTDADWKTQLTKGCRLLAVVKEIESGEYYTAVVELCFGIIERSLEAFAIVEGSDELRDFQTDSHDRCYDQAARFGLFTRELTHELKNLYGNNRTDSYYGGRHPTKRQAETMHRLARTIHQHVTDQIREGGVCNCDQ
ncbi:hepn domain-containing protein [Natrialba hulunbeirensis JCM 10989]|uniref:Hepn domain-containing protein n=2 Tax=Natrialba hulunbeirensis TaxID=123783 RepID=M0ABJ3_9EURY|nr:hepn domain-containing protein [Natrialba hulunbeirensis JCM 10989]